MILNLNLWKSSQDLHRFEIRQKIIEIKFDVTNIKNTLQIRKSFWKVCGKKQKIYKTTIPLVEAAFHAANLRRFYVKLV